MIFNYKSEKYNEWEENQNISFQRKLENETAFDGIVKIYSLKTNSDKINQLVKNKFFGDFFYPTKSGVFLREFDSKNSWSITSLIHIDLEKPSLVTILKTNSSWNVWTGSDQGNEKYTIAISPEKDIEYQVL